MAAYDKFGAFYDAIMGDRKQATEYLQELIRKANPRAKRILELGCGTGSVLKHLAANYDVWGLDLSKKMLSLAKRKVPQARLSHQEMVRFSLPGHFDVIFCVFDSINHVLDFRGWKQLFANVSQHLTEKGVFIFDINTQRKLDRLIAEPAWVHEFGDNLLIMRVTAAPKHGSNWNIKVFERTAPTRYLLHEENIQEVSFPVHDIVAAIRPHFRDVQIIDSSRKRPSLKSERLYFVCEKSS